ncbi:MAG: hypothetical protein J6E38_03410 [Clostridia bacterium]|nr:hypothetical protein [Clostridia bacterium]
MREKKSQFETQHHLKEEIESITDKGYNTVLIKDRDQTDRRRFTKIFDIKLNELIFNTDLERKYINFFILLVNINSRYIEPDLNIINLTTKEIADNLEFTTVYVYNCLKVLKEHDIIDYYKKGKSNFVVINPIYYARFYDIRYMYLVENTFKRKNVSITEIIDRIRILKNTKNNRKNKYINEQIKSYLTNQIED